LHIEEYVLSLEVDFASLNFSGHEKIRVAGPERELVLDSLGLTVKQVNALGKNLRFEQDEGAKKLKISGLPEGVASLEISLDYLGEITQRTLYGFYKSRYGSDYFITTDFEPNGARLLFPCIDNPAFKAVFSLDVTTQKELLVVSNAKKKQVLDLGEKVKHVFESTPKMSTYILYLGIGKFDQSTLRDRNVEFRVSTRPGYAIKGKYALESAAKFLRAYEDYYSIPYPLAKLDLIGLPEYASGAMENWGAITFREVVLLIDENSSVANKRSVTSVLGHEIAHMWFGDLVTMRWWNDLWLNESFATFMEGKMTNRLYPEWNVVSDFLQQTTAGAMHTDSLTSTHPIDVPVTAPEEISQIFDEISYGKGASVLRMIEAWVGQDAFRTGVSSYLSQFKYGNAEGKDLWQHLATASGQPVSEVMEAWISNAGFPVVRVSFTHGKLGFLQKRFFLNQERAQDQHRLWPIPISYTINGVEKKFLFKDETVEIPVNGIESIKVNCGQTGFYRVLYDQNLYSLIDKDFTRLGAFDRWGVLADLYAFLLAGKADLERYLEFAKRCASESEYLVADAATSHLQFLRFLSPDNHLVGQTYRAHHQAQIERLGLEPKSGEKDTDKLLRGRIATGLALVDKEFAGELAKRFREYESVDPNLRTAVAVSYAQTLGEQSYDELVGTMKRLGSEADVVKIYVALTSFRDDKLVERTLDLCVSGEISRADSLYAVMDASQNPYARKATWEWVKKNLGVFRELFRGTPYVSSLLQEVISKTGVGRESEVRNYVEGLKIEEGDKGIRKGLELLDIYSSLKRRLES
jgi:tricorn protease interacting factor F2/3